MIAMAPAIITSLIDCMGEWSNSNHFKETKALDAIHSFRVNIGNLISQPNNSYYENINRLNNKQMQGLVMLLNQWSVYIIDDVASDKIIKHAIGYELFIILISLFPTALKLKNKFKLDGYFVLIKKFQSDII